MNMQTIKLHCTDNDQVVNADVISKSDKGMVVLIKPGDIRVQLKSTRPGLYVGNFSGYEFVHKEG